MYKYLERIVRAVFLFFVGLLLGDYVMCWVMSHSVWSWAPQVFLFWCLWMVIATGILYLIVGTTDDVLESYSI